jgi:transposase
MDVDKEKIVLARLGAGKAKEVQEHAIANTPSAVKKYFSALLAGAEVHATYEAGCFGFGLYRQLSAMGVEVMVAAPGLIPRRPSDRIKTDRRDANTLALAFRAGQLTGIHVPTVQDESVRDYLRMYEDLRGDLRICKQHVLHFLLRRGIRYEQGGPWTVKPPAVERLKGLLHRQARLTQKPLDPFLMTQLPLALHDLLEVLLVAERLAAGHLRKILIAGQHPGKVQLPQTLP